VSDKLTILLTATARAFVVLGRPWRPRRTLKVRPSEAGLARDAIARLEARFKGQIQAGLNIAAALQIVGVDPHERQALRALRQRGDAPIPGDDDAGAADHGGERFAEGLKAAQSLGGRYRGAGVVHAHAAVAHLAAGPARLRAVEAVLAGCQALIRSA
jgi:type III secretion protein W